MKIELPKDLRTFAFRELTIIEPNDTDVERMLTQIFEMAIKQGRTAGNVAAAKLYDEKRALAGLQRSPRGIRRCARPRGP